MLANENCKFVTAYIEQMETLGAQWCKSELTFEEQARHIYEVLSKPEEMEYRKSLMTSETVDGVYMKSCLVGLDSAEDADTFMHAISVLYTDQDPSDIDIHNFYLERDSPLFKDLLGKFGNTSAAESTNLLSPQLIHHAMLMECTIPAMMKMLVDCTSQEDFEPYLTGIAQRKLGEKEHMDRKRRPKKPRMTPETKE